MRMLSLPDRYKIILMITVLILIPTLLSIVITQYENCKFLKKNCSREIPETNLPPPANPNDLEIQYLEEIVCDDTKPDATVPVLKDLGMDNKCYGFTPKMGNSPPLQGARLLWLGNTNLVDEGECYEQKPGILKRILKDINTGKCYSYSPTPGSSLPPLNSILIYIGGTS